MNSGKNLVLGYSLLSGGNSTTNSVYTTSKLSWNDSSATLSIYNSNESKYGYIKSDSIRLSNNSTEYVGLLITANVSGNRTYTLPDATGTIALTSNIPSVSSWALTSTDQEPNTVLAGPNSGTTNSTPTFRKLVVSDLPKGNESTALMGKGSSNAPAYTSVSPSISITDGTGSDAPKINLTVLNISGTAQALTKASTSIYGVTKLSSTLEDSETFAATPKMVYTLDQKVNGLLAAANALVYKGMRAGAATTGNNTYGALTPAADCGDIYIVSSPGYINGLYVEIGDMLICTSDDTAAASASTYTSIRTNWNIIQTSEGTVSTSETSVNDGNIVLFSGTTGRFIKNSSKSLTTTTPTSASEDTTIPTSKAVWNAIAALDGNLNSTTPGVGKTLTAFSQTDGVVSATFGNIEISITANATDGLWNVEGTNNNNTNTVSYSISPYTTQQNTASFDSSTTKPTLTTRLNYNGHLYTTALSTDNVYIGTNNSYGDAYTPIYWNDGVPAPVTMIQKATFSLTTSNSGIVTINTNTSSNSRVIQIVVTSGFSYLKSTIKWEINSSAIKLSSTVDGTVNGYILYTK